MARRTPRHGALVYRERGRHPDVVRHQVAEGRLHRLAAHVQRRHHAAIGGRAKIRLLRRIVFRIGEERMLQVIDAERHGLAVADGAEVSGDLDPVLVGLVDHRRELGVADRAVHLDPGGTLLGPVSDGAPRLLLVGSPQRTERLEPRVGRRTNDVRPGDVHVRPRRVAPLDLRFEIQLRIRTHAARRADRGHTAAQVQPRVAVVALNRPLGAVREVERVIVHPDEAGNHRVSGEIHHPGTRRSRHGSNGLNVPARNHDRLVTGGRCAGAVDQPDMGERHDRRIDRDIRPYRVRGRRCLARQRRRNKSHQGKEVP